MRRVLGLLATGLVYLCVGTVLAEGFVVAVFWSRGMLAQDRVFRMLAAAYGIDLAAMEAERAAALRDRDAEQVAMEQVIRARVMKSLDIDLREQALERAQAELAVLQGTLQDERRRYDLLKTSFDDQLAVLQRGTRDNAIGEVQRTLEAVHPKQAKDQLLKMLEENEMQSVVLIMKAMPIDKRKKIIAEFKTEEESDKLADILKQIRLGVPEISLIDDTRNRLQEFNPQRQ
jgi:hypothetical protein